MKNIQKMLCALFMGLMFVGSFENLNAMKRKRTERQEEELEEERKRGDGEKRRKEDLEPSVPVNLGLSANDVVPEGLLRIFSQQDEALENSLNENNQQHRVESESSVVNLSIDPLDAIPDFPLTRGLLDSGLEPESRKKFDGTPDLRFKANWSSREEVRGEKINELLVSGSALSKKVLKNKWAQDALLEKARSSGNNQYNNNGSEDGGGGLDDDEFVSSSNSQLSGMDNRLSGFLSPELNRTVDQSGIGVSGQGDLANGNGGSENKPYNNRQVRLNKIFQDLEANLPKGNSNDSGGDFMSNNFPKRCSFNFDGNSSSDKSDSSDDESDDEGKKRNFKMLNDSKPRDFNGYNYEFVGDENSQEFTGHWVKIPEWKQNKPKTVAPIELGVNNGNGANDDTIPVLSDRELGINSGDLRDPQTPDTSAHKRVKKMAAKRLKRIVNLFVIAIDIGLFLYNTYQTATSGSLCWKTLDKYIKDKIGGKHNYLIKMSAGNAGKVGLQILFADIFTFLPMLLPFCFTLLGGTISNKGMIPGLIYMGIESLACYLFGNGYSLYKKLEPVSLIKRN